MAESAYWSGSRVSGAFNISERRLRQLATQGKIPHAARGKGYPVYESVAGYVLYLQPFQGVWPRRLPGKPVR